MVITRSAQYAIRAMRYLALQRSTDFCKIEEIARETKIPRPFLAKLIQQLAKKSLVSSLKGASGGVKLKQPIKQITLFMIADAVQDLSDSGQCLLGYGPCSEVMKCSAHDGWRDLHQKQVDYIKRITLLELIKEQEEREDQ
jgi:Rrf2 family protein